VANPRSRDNGSSTCTDIVGDKGGNHGLFIQHNRKSGGILTGSRNGISNGSWDNVPLAIAAASITPAYSMSEETAALKGFNLANPSRHNVKLPAFIAELRDLPNMLRFAGRILHNLDVPRDLILRAFSVSKGLMGNQHRRALSAKEVLFLSAKHLTPDQQGGLSNLKAIAAANLAWQFGWRPLIQDVYTMSGFAKAVEERREEINRLYSGRGLKRKITLQDTSAVSVVTNAALHSVLGLCQADVTTRSTTKIWTSVRFKPKDKSALPPTDGAILQTVLGLDPHGVISSAWEILPWSWFADWFSDLGEVMEISSNAMNAQGYCNVMRSQKTTVSCPGGVYVFSNGTKTISRYEARVETKNRKPGLPDLTSLSVRLPILGSNQVSILGSIAMLRGKR